MLTGCRDCAYSIHMEAAGQRIEVPGTSYYLIRRVSGYTYPRNGNLDNPTPRFAWDTYRVDGSRVGSSITKAAAIELITYDVEDES